jgi:hypothetical protein
LLLGFSEFARKKRFLFVITYFPVKERLKNVSERGYNLGGQKVVDHRQENRRLVGHFYDMKNRFWAVGCGLGCAVE